MRVLVTCRGDQPIAGAVDSSEGLIVVGDRDAAFRFFCPACGNVHDRRINQWETAKLLDAGTPVADQWVDQ